MNNNICCVICLQEILPSSIIELIKTPCCSNNYCRRCLLNWSVTFETIEYSCPACRGKLNKLDSGFFLCKKFRTRVKF